MNNFIRDIFIEKFDNYGKEASEIITKNPIFQRQGQLYHYTSLGSIEAMIKAQSIRASSIYSMNDPNELTFGQEQLSNRFSQKLSTKLKQEYSHQSFYNFPAFVFSLSELPDDMHQWDKYGDQHKGIRIGFTPKNLLEYWSKIDGVNVFLVPVVYHDNGSKFLEPYGEVFSKMIKEFISNTESHYSDREMDYPELNELKTICSLISSMIKRIEWSGEKEWRIICIPSGSYHKNIHGNFQNGKSNVYIENRTFDTLKMFTNDGHDNVASKDILKIGCNAGDKNQIEYILSLLFDKKVIMTVSQSEIQTR